jgi:hypothetical protein
MSGKMSKDEAYANFLATFEGVSTTKDGKITPQEWLQYYSMISSSIDEDDYFEVRTCVPTVKPTSFFNVFSSTVGSGVLCSTVSVTELCATVLQHAASD